MTASSDGLPAEPGSERVARIVASHALLRVFGLAIPALVTPLALRLMGRDRYGAWLLGASLAGYAAQTLGIANAQVDLTAAAKANSSERSVAAFFIHALALLAIAGATLLLVGPVIMRWAGLPSSETAILWVALALAAAGLPLMAVRGLAEGLQEVHRLNLASALSVLVAAPLTLLALELWPSALWLYLPLAAVNVAGPLIVLPALWRQYGGIERAAGWSLAVGCELLRRGAWFTVVGAAWAVIYGVDVWVVQRFCGLSEVASYGLSFMLFGLLAEPLAALVMALRPIAGRLGASGSTAPAVLFRKTVRLAVVAGISVNGAGLLWFGLAMDIWVGATVDGDLRVAFFLASFQALRALLNSCAWILVPVDGPRRLGLALTVDAAVNLVASMCLAREVGPWGVAAGSLLGILSCSGWYVPLRARQAFQIPLFGPWLPVAIIAAAPLWILGLIWRPRLATFSGPAGPLTAACCLGATAVVVLTLIWFAGLEDQERDLVRNRIRRSR